MAESSNPATAPTGGPATPPKVLPWLLAYTLGRLVIAAALIGLLWAVGLGGYPALLFGALLSMPVAYFVLQPVRDRFTEALAAVGVARPWALVGLLAAPLAVPPARTVLSGERPDQRRHGGAHPGDRRPAGRGAGPQRLSRLTRGQAPRAGPATPPWRPGGPHCARRAPR